MSDSTKEQNTAANLVAVVTGGGRGIGRAVCLELASRGYSVVVNYSHSSDAADEVVSQIKAQGSEAIAVKADVSDHDEAKALIDAAIEHFGHIDVLVNNAGITRDNLMMRMSSEDFESVVKVNLEGTFNCMKHVARPMLKQRKGAIVNIASVVGVIGNAGQANYAASKAGIIGMTKSAARELASRNIRVNAVAPGFIDTSMTQVLSDKAKEALQSQILLGRLGQPEDIAKAVAFLAGEEASYITGQVICVDGGIAI